MSIILLVVGILVTGAGVVATGFGIPINESGLGQTLIIAGATGIVGGLTLVALAAVVSQLSLIAEALQSRPLARTAIPAEIKQPVPPAEPKSEVRPPAEVRRRADPPVLEQRPPEPRAPEPKAPEPAAAADVSSSAIERLRSTMARPDVAEAEEVPLSPNGGHHPPDMPPARAEPARPVATVDASPKEPKLDFLFRGKPKRPPQPESFDSMWPKRGAPDQVRGDEVARQAPAEAPPQLEERRAPPPAPPVETRTVAILKSGVVDGMAYTLYADGSIEAQLPHGTVRFGSIAELRAHIENNS